MRLAHYIRRSCVPVWLALLTAFPAAGQERIHFIGIETSPEDKKADERLYKYLEKRANLRFQTQNMPYSAGIRRLSEWNSKAAYLVRMTPFAYVAAELLGARFEVLGTYWSKATASATYNSYFVVNKEAFKIFENSRTARMRRSAAAAAAPARPGPARVAVDTSGPLMESLVETELGPDYLVDFLKSKQPARFLYHDKFSTSSFLLPALFFRRNYIYATTTSSDKFTPIQVDKAPPGKGTSFLVDEVAAGRADLAAVSSAAKKKAESGPNRGVYFIRQPTNLPNDLLICSPWLDGETKKRIRDAIRGMSQNEIDTGDFAYWVDIEEAVLAREALANLRRAARERPAPVTVRVEAAGEKGKVPPPEYLEAARQALLLSGTEFVLFDPDYHRRADISWTLEFTHDGAIVLTSDIEGFEGSELETQTARISFMDTKDLTRRIGMLIHSRLHRVRYVWAYEDKYPAVIRDLDFTPDENVKVQRITWIDPDRNEYEDDTPFEAKIVKSDFHKFQLSENGFPRRPDGGFHFDPLSNVAYRVILKAKSNENPIFTTLTWVFVAAFALAMAGFVWDLRRVRPPPAGFSQTCQWLAEEFLRPWKERQISEGDVLWCNAAEIGKLINQLRGSDGRLAKEAGEVAIPLPFLSVKLSLLTNLFSWIFGRRKGLPAELADPSGVGNAAALDSALQHMMARRQLAPFVGRPLGWDALDSIALRHFQRLGIAPNSRDAHVQRSGLGLSSLVSRHFLEVVEKGEKHAIFFRRSWQLENHGDRYRLSSTEQLDGELKLGAEEGAFKALTMEFEIPADTELRDALAAANGEAWLLGKIRNRTRPGAGGAGELRLQILPLALVKA